MSTNSIKEALEAAITSSIGKTRPAPPALRTTLNEWAKDDTAHVQYQPRPQSEETAMPAQAHPRAPAESGKHVFQPTVNVTKHTFEYVRDNPGVQHRAAKEALVAQGFKASSVDSLLYQMFVQDVFTRDEHGGYCVTSHTFPGLKSGAGARKLREEKAAQRKKDAANAKRSATMKAKAVAAKAAPAPAPRSKQLSSSGVSANALPNLQPVSSNRVDAILSGVSVFEAKLIYEALKKMFKD